MLVGEQDSAVALHGNIAAFWSVHIGWCIIYLMRVWKCELWTIRSIKRSCFKGQAGNSKYWSHNEDSLSLELLQQEYLASQYANMKALWHYQTHGLQSPPKNPGNWEAQLDIAWCTPSTPEPSWLKLDTPKRAVLLHLYQICDPIGLKTGLQRPIMRIKSWSWDCIYWCQGLFHLSAHSDEVHNYWPVILKYRNCFSALAHHEKQSCFYCGQV